MKFIIVGKNIELTPGLKGIEDGMNFEGNYSVSATGNGTGVMGGTSFGTVNININGANYSDENALADAISQRLQAMSNRRSAVYA